MASEAVVKTIELIIAPVVMITACGVIQNGVIAHYNSISDRLRLVNQEILSLLEADLHLIPAKSEHSPDLEQLLKADTFKTTLKTEHLHDLEHHLLPNLFHRHHILHHVLGLIYFSILMLILDMLNIAIATATSIGLLSQLVIITFLIGVGALFGAVGLIAYEIYLSHDSLQLEIHRNCQWCMHRPYKHRYSVVRRH